MDVQRMIIVIFAMVAIMDIVEGDSTLKPGFGVHFKSVGQVQTVIFRKYLALDILLPSYVSIRDLVDQPIDCAPEKFHFSTSSISEIKAYRPAMEICYRLKATVQDLVKLVEEHERAIDTRIDSINSIIRNNVNTERIGNVRHKRGIAAIFSVVTGIASFFSNYAQNRQLKGMQRTVDYLVNNDFKVKNRLNEISSDLALIANGTAKEFSKVRQDINSVARQLEQVAHNVTNHLDVIYGWLKRLQDNVQILNQLSETVIYAHNVSISIAEISRKLTMHFEEERDYLRQYETGLIDLLNGKLPATLVNPETLVHIISELKEQTLRTEPNYVVMFDRLNQYFRKTDIQYSVVENHIILSMPVYLVKANQKPLTLYQIESCYVPYTNDINNHPNKESYTKVNFDHTYIAVEGENFIELNPAQLQNCQRIDLLYLCEDPLVQLSQRALTCSSAIFFNHKPDIVNKHCDFRYIHQVEPPPCVLESDNQILLSNIGEHWSFRCDSENVPKRMTGSNYAVINRKSLCKCALTGDKFYIPERLSYCDDKSYEVKIRYPINAISATVFHHRILDRKVLQNLSQLYPTPRVLGLPLIEFEKPETDLSIAVSRDYSKEIDMHHLAKLLDNKEPLHWDAQEKAQHSMRINNWFKTVDTIAIGVTFILSILGLIALVISTYNCMKSHRIASLFGILMSKLQTAESLNPEECENNQITYTIIDKLVQLLIFVLLWLIYRLIKRILFNWSMIKITHPSIIRSDDRPYSHFTMEIFSPIFGVSRLYLASAKVTIADISWISEPRIKSMKIAIERSRIVNNLKIEWGREDLITCKGIPFQLPLVASVPYFKVNRVSKILAEEHNLRILVTCQGLTYCTYFQRNTMQDVQDIRPRKSPKFRRNVCIANYQTNIELLEIDNGTDNDLNAETTMQPSAEVPNDPAEFMTRQDMISRY